MLIPNDMYEIYLQLLQLHHMNVQISTFTCLPISNFLVAFN